MTVPDRRIIVVDGGMGVTKVTTTHKFAVIGPASAGSYLVPQSFTSPQTLVNAFTSGPGVDFAQKVLNDSGGQCVFVRCVCSTASVATTGAPTQAVSSTGSCAISGTPVNDYRIAVEILSSGDVGVATFKYSLDAGPDDTNEELRNWSTAILVPAGGTYVIGDTGVTLTFTGGASTAFTDGDVFYFAEAAAAPTLADIQDAIDSIRTSNYDVEIVYIVGESSNTIKAGVATKIEAWASTYNRYSRACIEATDVDPIGTVSSTGTTPPTVTVTGLPLESWDVVIDIGTGGALGTATFTYSLDGGETFSSAITTTAVTGINPISGTGMIFTFADDTYNADNEYTFSTWDKETNRAAWASALSTAYTNTSTRVIVCAGFGECAQADGQIKRRNIAWGVASLIAKVGLSTDLGSIAEAGQLPGFLSISHDEYKTPGLDDAGFCTARTWNSATGELKGIFCNQGRVMSPPGSDYDLIQYGRVMDAACKSLDTQLALTVNRKILVDPDTGYIDEGTARAYDRKFLSAVEEVTTKRGHASGASVAMTRDENLLSTRAGTVSVRLTGVAYIKDLTGYVGYRNPALET